MDQLLPWIQTIDDRRDNMVQLVQRLCNVNSGTMNLDGIRQVSELLQAEYRVLGGETQIRDIDPLESVDDKGKPVIQQLAPLIHITKRTECRPRIILCIHMDTVYAPDHPFQTCRWLDERRLNGPGVADAKGGLVVMLNALRVVEECPWADKLGWEVIINPDEELGSPGSTRFLQERAREADWGLLFEPAYADGSLVSWRKGAGNFDFVVRGRSAHAGRDFGSGRNAIAALARLLVEIDEWNTDPAVTFNIGRISGGGPLNVVPDVAVGRVNVRVTTTEQRDRVEKQFADLVAKFNQRDGISVEFSGTFRSAPKLIDEQTAQLQRLIERCGQLLGIDIQWRGTGGASDGNKFAAVGLPNIDTLGPVGGNIHSEQEFLLVDSLVPRAKLAALVMLNLAAEGSQS